MENLLEDFCLDENHAVHICNKAEATTFFRLVGIVFPNQRYTVNMGNWDKFPFFYSNNRGIHGCSSPLRFESVISFQEFKKMYDFDNEEFLKTLESLL